MYALHPRKVGKHGVDFYVIIIVLADNAKKVVSIT
jgi:hypothetical protein